jgi:CheY-like chemotaxis protein
VDLNRNSTVEGVGLGLAITYRLLEKMGGEIHVQSIYGKGSTFSIRIPQKVVSWKPMGDFQLKPEKNSWGLKTYEAHFHAPKARILVVDDTRMNLSVAVGLLKKTDIQIDTATSGAGAIELAKETDYDLILMDQRMPGMDGTQALWKIREQGGANADIPVICLTADAVIGAREHYIADGFTDYLTKPIDSQELERIMIRYIPKEKIITMKNDGWHDIPDTVSHDGSVDALFNALRSAGIQPEEGLRFCQEDEELYRSLLWEYANEAEDKACKLRRYYAEKDWKNYAIIAHAIKSSSRSLGATSLSAVAASAESAADEGDIIGVDQVHEDMLFRYDYLVKLILQLSPDQETAQLSDDDIIEFMPES